MGSINTKNRLQVQLQTKKLCGIHLIENPANGKKSMPHNEKFCAHNSWKWPKNYFWQKMCMGHSFIWKCPIVYGFKLLHAFRDLENYLQIEVNLKINVSKSLWLFFIPCLDCDMI